MAHEPRLQLSKLGPHLAPKLGLALGRCPLVLGVFTMRRTSGCKARQVILCVGSCGSATVQGTASVALVRRPLAGRAFSGLGPAPLARPIGANGAMGYPSQGCYLSC